MTSPPLNLNLNLSLNLLMAITPTRWILPTPPAPEVRARLEWLHPVILQVVYNRGLQEPEEVREFFGERVRPDDPFQMKGVNEAVARLRWAIGKGERIAIYGDFDADGVTATALMVQTLSALGADVTPYIPHRIDEGYGLNDDALKFLHEQGIRLVLTVDCGIRSVAEVRRGRALGLDMIVSDHHSVGPELPPALAVINPRQPGCKYHFKEFAGVGVAFKLAQGLLRAERAASVARRPVDLVEEDLQDLVALGTVADIMPLRGENRLLVQRGLQQLNQARRPGVLALLHASGTAPGQVDATAIGFRLGPRLNAAGRLHTAQLAYDLLMAPDEDAAGEKAKELDDLNRKRQSMTQKAVDWAVSELGDDPPDHVLFVGRPDLSPGILGLIAGRLKEIYYRPAIVAELGEEEVRGSARSVPEFDITAALDRCASLLVRHGGHRMAAGFTIERQRLPRLRQELNHIASEALAEAERVRRLHIDAVLGLHELDYALLARLRELEPTGNDNPPALLAFPRLLIKDRRRVGKDGAHLKLRLSDGNMTIDAIGFGFGDQADTLPMQIDVAGFLGENVYQGHSSLQLTLQDLQPAGRGISPDHHTPATE